MGMVKSIFSPQEETQWKGKVLLIILAVSQYLEAAGHDDGTHIVRFCSYGEFAFFVGATNRMFDKQASGSGTCPCPQNVFNLFVYQIVMDTIGTEEDAVTRVDRDLVRVNGWGQWATQRLGNTTSQPEIAVFCIR